MKKQIQIFKPGKHTASSGVALSFTEADLKASASAYDPAKHEAPIVVGHPSHDAPAYGWVKSLSYADGLDAEPQQVDPAFAEMVDRGAFKKISASFYSPDSPNNPVPGVYYLRHVGFLGAQPPAVKGLRNPEFKDTETGVVEFTDYDDVVNASLWRRMRDWLIGEKGLAVADNILPDYSISTLETAAQQEDDDQPNAGVGASTSYSEKGSDQVTPEQAAALTAENTKLKTEITTLQTDNAKFKKDAADFTEAQARVKVEKAHTDNVAFAEGLVKAGKLLPAVKGQIVALMDNLAAQEVSVEFGEGDAKKSSTALELYKAQLEASPVIVNFNEVGKDGAGSSTVEFSAPSGFTVDADRLELHQKTLDYQKQHKTTYEAALTAVSA
jgi:hypothetical protein